MNERNRRISLIAPLPPELHELVAAHAKSALQKNMRKTLMQIRVSEGTHERLGQVAEYLNMTVTALVNDYIQDGLESDFIMLLKK